MRSLRAFIARVGVSGIQHNFIHRCFLARIFAIEDYSEETTHDAYAQQSSRAPGLFSIQAARLTFNRRAERLPFAIAGCESDARIVGEAPGLLSQR